MLLWTISLCYQRELNLLAEPASNNKVRKAEAKKEYNALLMGKTLLNS